MFSWNWRDFMRNVHGFAFLLDFTSKNHGIAETQWKNFLFESFIKIWKFIFCQSESCVLMMSSWSRRVKICGLNSSIEVQLPIVSGYLKKMLYSCLCTSFMSCYCVLTEKIDETGSVVTIDHFSRLRVLVHEMASRPLAQFDLILAWASWKLLWAT